MEYVTRAKPDGYTVFVHAGSGAAASMSLLKKPSVDVPRQIQVAGTINRQPYMIVVHQSKPYKTLAELTAAMKEKGDKATYGTSNPSSTILAEIYTQHDRREGGPGRLQDRRRHGERPRQRRSSILPPPIRCRR